MNAVVVLALVAALCFGAADFAGGLLSKSAHYAVVGLVGQSAAAVLAVVAAVVVGASPNGPALAWGALAGAGGALGTLALYRGLAAGRMNVAGPLSAVGSAGVPVIVDLVLGQRLSLLAMIGIGLAIPGILLVSTGSEPGPGGTKGVAEGLLAGLGFAGLLVFLDVAGEGSGLWPVVSAQLTSAVILAVLVVATRPQGPAPSWHAVWPGILGVIATVTYFLATHQGSLSVAAVITSLYPAVTVVLAAAVLKERTTALHAVGLLLCAVSVGTFAAG